jgi:hypothetical protein
MPTLSPAQPSRAKTLQFPSFVLDSQEILNVPHTGKELSRQLGEGGWKLSRLRFLLTCGLVRSHFEQPYNPR